MNVNLNDLTKTHGENAKSIFRQVAEIAGAGDPGDLHDGGIDITGLSDSKKERIAALIVASGKKEAVAAATDDKKAASTKAEENKGVK